MSKITPCLLFAITLCTSLPAQVKTDTLVDKLILKSQYQEALDLLGQVPPSVWRENKRAETFIRLGDYQNAQRILNNLNSQWADSSGPLARAVTLTNTGFLQLTLGRQDRAEESLLAALAFLETEARQHPDETAQALSLLGLVYMSQGQYAQAQERLHRALTVRHTLTRNKREWVAASYNDLGLAYSQTDHLRALEYYDEARRLYTTLYGERDPKVAISKINTGIIYRDLERFDEAIENFEQALTIWNAVHTGPHPAKALALYNLGQSYLGLNDQQSAEEYYRQALHMYPPRHPETASVLNAIGNLYVAQHRFDEALAVYDEALAVNTAGEDDTRHEAYYNGSVFLHTMLFKAQALEARYMLRSLKFSDLREALDILTECDSLIDELRHQSADESDKLRLGEMANEVYADGVRIAYHAALNALKKDAYFAQAFYFAEKSKSAVLLEAISDTDAKSYAGIPSSLLEEEKQLKAALGRIARQLADAPSPDEERVLRDSAYHIRRDYDAFIQRLEREYPAYFDLKFNVAAPAIADLQALLGEQTALISYFIDEKSRHLYIFLVRHNQYKVWQRPLDASFDKYITGLRNGLYFREPHTYTTSAYHLGRTLIPRLPASVTDLVILPAGRLALIPFETLLLDNPRATDSHPSINYGTMPYLLTRYHVRYAFSAGLVAQFSKKGSSGKESSILLCAPVQFPERPYLARLPGTANEVAAISGLFRDRQLSASAYTGSNASEERLRSETLDRFRYLHFATHGLVDEYQPELSRLFLLGGETHDGELFAGEIYNLELDAELVTLSACQTGLGKLQKGEGVIGLSRALVYAGARNIVVSFWNVADESTAIMMKDFYQEMLTRRDEHGSHALRNAKLRLLADDRYAAPYYWAPFVWIGW